MENLNKLKELNKELLNIKSEWGKNKQIIFNVVSKYKCEDILICEDLETSIRLIVNLPLVFSITYTYKVATGNISANLIKGYAGELVKSYSLSEINEAKIDEITNKLIGDIFNQFEKRKIIPKFYR